MILNIKINKNNTFLITILQGQSQKYIPVAVYTIFFLKKK